jgi:hypothetical protein
MDAQLSGKFAAGGDAIAVAQLTAVDKGAKLVAQLDVQRYVAFGLEVKWQHWLDLVGQYTGAIVPVKSQFVLGAGDLKPQLNTDER